MGGLLIADATLAIADSRLEKTAPLWPRIIACIAFDTPYYGLHPFVFKNQTSKAVTYAQGAHKLASSLGLFGAAADAKSQGSSSGTSTPKSEPLALTAPPNTAPASSAKGGWTKWAPAALGAVVAGAAAGAGQAGRLRDQQLHQGAAGLPEEADVYGHPEPRRRDLRLRLLLRHLYRAHPAPARPAPIVPLFTRLGPLQ